MSAKLKTASEIWRRPRAGTKNGFATRALPEAVKTSSPKINDTATRASTTTQSQANGINYVSRARGHREHQREEQDDRKMPSSHPRVEMMPRATTTGPSVPPLSMR